MHVYVMGANRVLFLRRCSNDVKAIEVERANHVTLSYFTVYKASNL